MAKVEKKIAVHRIAVEIMGEDGKTYDGAIAYGAGSWAAKADDPNRDELGKEAAILVAVRHAESMGTAWDGAEPVVIFDGDEVLDVEFESDEG